ncbi:hypothetical protein IG522_17575 [Vibrio cholerae]|uniref:hypothetical protein n=1 Tax=Vibrio cholerae TaxID=666 RepID=UPI00226DA829|nr:hypothetical protein [Vibrio cholerae]MCX9469286.1 hypothetical protein [Vibrio cholerae]
MSMFKVRNTNLRIFSVLLLFSFILSGCKSSEEKLFDACINNLKKELETWAKYDGWSVDRAKATLYKMEPDIEKNTKYKTDQFWTFEVLISEFTVKNGFNADVKSVSSCTGYISKDSKGEYEPPEGYAIDLTLNGKKLGI